MKFPKVSSSPFNIKSYALNDTKPNISEYTTFFDKDIYLLNFRVFLTFGIYYFPFTLNAGKNVVKMEYIGSTDNKLKNTH